MRPEVFAFISPSVKYNFWHRGNKRSYLLSGERRFCRGAARRFAVRKAPAGPGRPRKEIREHGAFGKHANKFLNVNGRVIAAQLSDGPLPAITRRLQRHADQCAGGELRTDRPTRKRGDSESTDH